MKITNELADSAALAEIGERVAHRRVEAGLTQAKLAEEAGVSKRTVERLEAGSSVQLTSLVRLLRTLSLLGGLDVALPPAAPGPMELLQRGRTRQRVKPGSPEKTPERWHWNGDR